MKEFFLISWQDMGRQWFVSAYEQIRCKKSWHVRRLFAEQTDVYYSFDKLTTKVGKILWQWKLLPTQNKTNNNKILGYVF